MVHDYLYTRQFQIANLYTFSKVSLAAKNSLSCLALFKNRKAF